MMYKDDICHVCAFISWMICSAVRFAACATCMVFRADLAEDEIVYSHCCIHKHGRQEDVQEEICRLNP